MGDSAAPECCAVPMIRLYHVSKPIARPKGYHLRPGDKGYWDFGDLNHPLYEPPTERIEPFQAERERQAYLASSAHDRDWLEGADADGDA
jgi:hypothetical protein